MKLIVRDYDLHRLGYCLGEAGRVDDTLACEVGPGWMLTVRNAVRTAKEKTGTLR